MTGAEASGAVIHGARKLDADGQIDDFWLVSSEDRITAVGHGDGWRQHVEGRNVTDAGGGWLTPGFIDLHGHGGGGHGFDNGPEEILAGLATHRAHGTTRSVISLVANPLAQLRESLSTIADLTDLDPLILGSHLEGPFLAIERRGAHDPAFIRDPQPEMLEELIGAARGTLRQITIAPERPNALEAIEVLLEAGVIVGIGHTEADYEQTKRAFEVGARLLTHTFNAMNGIHHRQPGPIIAAFENHDVTLELILDGLHVHPEVARLAFRSAPGRVALITDAMAAAGSTDGDYRLGSLNVTVTDGLAVLSGTNSIAGSTLTQDAALRIAVTQSGIEPRAAVEALTATPATALGLSHEFGHLRPGFAADAVLLDHEWAVQQVWAAGTALPAGSRE
ncbi:N-acetylglucosamine-6-phosphate deacetylase [Leifsonia sp. Root112D2]|uniref:N-acetylglucosamine-6-phosphate deacetylase n=1 Tax=Leifsonia sp. Root112D2 TaxID=1736426 RepID=UPI0006F24ACC|nr:N-acetylglucosamine-6-phosphate deacetylase [Leifsonia sp. Root112D2]KQV07271.1 N-acetylglucosamine-6-phosphate deacetylase [Leifsonia sp. Root112D2]